MNQILKYNIFEAKAINKEKEEIIEDYFLEFIDNNIDVDIQYGYLTKNKFMGYSIDTSPRLDSIPGYAIIVNIGIFRAEMDIEMLSKYITEIKKLESILNRIKSSYDVSMMIDNDIEVYLIEKNRTSTFESKLKIILADVVIYNQHFFTSLGKIFKNDDMIENGDGDELNDHIYDVMKKRKLVTDNTIIIPINSGKSITDGADWLRKNHYSRLMTSVRTRLKKTPGDIYKSIKLNIKDDNLIITVLP